MQWKNSTTHFGIIAVVLHWLVAVTVIGLFALGWWMTELDYYDSWYKIGPWWHKSIGITLFAVMLFRLFWRFFTAPPQPLLSHKSWEVRVAHGVHKLLYLMILSIMISGYLISTEDGQPILVFDWIAIPATITSIPDQADMSGWVHLVLASSFIGMVLLHAGAALKHHFIDRDRSLLRIFGQ